MTLGLHDVTYRYRRGGPSAVSGLTLAVQPGRTVLLGPNGAGKTTLLRLAASSIAPHRGAVTLADLDPSRRRDRGRFRSMVGWMPQEVRAIAGFTCREQVAYLGWLKGLSRSIAWTAARVALHRVGLSAEMDRRASDVSGGQLRRVGLAQALVTRPVLLLLDEPTAGLDPVQRASFRGLVRELPAETIVLVSTHQVDDLSDLFDAVVVMDGGALRWQGEVARFLALAPSGSVRSAEEAYAAIVAGAG
jgi:ABC-2 type transport system ATP-binding protein